MSADKIRPECGDPLIGAWLVPYALGTLGDADAEQFERHLLHCPACRQELEEAAPTLETLAAAREQFVLRAHREKEDFESQYERLLNKTETEVSRVAAERQSWMETVWMALWNRKWIVGAVGAAAVAILFGIRPGPESIPPPYAINETPLMQPNIMRQRVSPESDGSEGVSDPAEEQIIADKSAIAPSPDASVVREKPNPVEAPNMAVVSPPKLSNQAETAMVEPSTLMKRVPVISSEQSPQSSDLGEPLADQVSGEVIPMTLSLSEESAPAATNMVYEAPVQAAEGIRHDRPESSPDLRQLADLVLGQFDLMQYRYPDSANRAGSPAQMDVSYKSISAAPEKSAIPKAIPADTLFARGLYSEARAQFERQWAADTTNIRAKVMAGIAALAQKDYSGANRTFETVSRQLPQGIQKEHISLLLARTNILRGRTDIARDWLQNLYHSSSDSSRRETARQALARIDSLRTPPPPK